MKIHVYIIFVRYQTSHTHLLMASSSTSDEKANVLLACTPCTKEELSVLGPRLKNLHLHIFHQDKLTHAKVFFPLFFTK